MTIEAIVTIVIDVIARLATIAVSSGVNIQEIYDKISVELARIAMQEEKDREIERTIIAGER